jgi:NADPH:quinone reductase-like Zn-dependent oxidoreductase
VAGQISYAREIMKAIQIVHFGGPEVFRVVEGQSPPMLPDHVRIRVSAAGINFADVQMRMGLYPEAPRLPFVPGFEVAGVITETGPGVQSFHRGERVLAGCRFGGYSTEIVLAASQVRKTPRKLSDVEAASIPVCFITAWIALMEMARVREGDKVLVANAAGGVGSAAIQMAALAGAQVIGLVGSADKKETVRSLGAGQVLTYGELHSREDSRDFDVILDPRGGAELKDSLGRLAPGGRVVSFGASSIVGGLKRSIPRTLLGLLQTPLLNPIGLGAKNRGVFGLNSLPLYDSERGKRLLARALDAALEGFETGRYRTLVGKVFPLEKAGAAHEYLQSRKNVGKIVLRCN